LGNPGWSWQSLLPYFLKSESYIAPSDETATDLNTNSEFDPSVHGRSGPVVHGFPEEYGPFEEAWWSESVPIRLLLALDLAALSMSF
jgi:choline dehydrogenase-like flavoprotein